MLTQIARMDGGSFLRQLVPNERLDTDSDLLAKRTAGRELLQVGCIAESACVLEDVSSSCSMLHDRTSVPTMRGMHSIPA